MTYEEAVKKWGARQLELRHYDLSEIEVLGVDFEMNPGYACCGGRDPDCYCSFAESASLEATIRYWYRDSHEKSSYTCSDIDMGETIREVVEME